MHWRPSLAELTGPMVQPRSWAISLETFGKGIDNAHIDCLVSARFRDQAAQTVRNLIREDVSALSRRVPEQLVSGEDLAAFREGYLSLFETALERSPGKGFRDHLVLLQLALVKLLLQLAARETHAVQEEIKAQLQSGSQTEDPGHAELRDQLVLLARQAQGIQRRVLQLLFRQIRKLETGHLQNLRASVIGTQWPVAETILFNPVLLIPDPGEERALAADYAIGWLAESGVGDWLARTESALAETFAHYLPEWLGPDGEPEPAVGSVGHRPLERRDQGQLRGFVATEILLDQFVPRLEYRQGLTTWLDEPANLRLFLDSVPAVGAEPAGRAQGTATRWPHPEWTAFQRATLGQLRERLEHSGLGRIVEIAYALPALKTQLGHPLPLSLVLDHAEGRLTRRRLDQRLATLRTGLDPATVQTAMDRMLAALRHRTDEAVESLLGRYLVDFLTLRRDLKLAFKTFELLDGIHLVEDAEEARLSRSNRSLYELPCRGETGQQPRPVRSHAVVKADVRGSTLITEELRARGLNPASHFSLNFFNPVNKLLPEFGAEKLFVEGDAVIVALYEYADEEPGLAVAQACRLSRKILQVVMLQNLQNRKLGLPELELGLGISFSRREPNFLYDEGRRIMISSAINQADRLSSCSGLLRRSGFEPASPAFRVSVVRDAVGGERAGPGRDLLNHNVNGVKLDEGAFLKLQEELVMSQLRLPDREAPESLFFQGGFADAEGQTHWIVLRHAPVLDWYGDSVGPVEPERRHYFELIVDEHLATRVRRLAEGRD
jgi:hypothetical protein